MVLSVRRTAGLEVFSMEGEASDLRNVDSRAGNPLYIRNMYIYIYTYTHIYIYAIHVYVWEPLVHESFQSNHKVGGTFTFVILSSSFW